MIRSLMLSAAVFAAAQFVAADLVLAEDVEISVWSRADRSGPLRAGNLVTGGPYTITATATGFEGQTVENVRINLSGATSLSFDLSPSASEATIVVTAARANLVFMVAPACMLPVFARLRASKTKPRSL